MSLEILAEAAAALVPGLAVTGLRDVRADRWLAWDDEPRALEVTARRLGSEGADDASTSSWTRRGRATRTARRRPPSRRPSCSRPVPGRRRRRGPRARRSPRVGAGRTAGSTTTSCSTARLAGRPRHRADRSRAPCRARGAAVRTGLCAGRSSRAFGLDPVVARRRRPGDRLLGGRAVRARPGRVPVRLDALDVFGPQRPAGEALDALGGDRAVGDQLVRSDIDVVGEDGVVLDAADGLGGQALRRPAASRPPAACVADRRRSGATGPSRRPSPRGAARSMPAAHGAAARPRALEARVGAPRALARRARAASRRCGPAPRVLEWLGARTAAKEAVIALLRSTPAWSCCPPTSRSPGRGGPPAGRAAPTLDDAGLALSSRWRTRTATPFALAGSKAASASTLSGCGRTGRLRSGRVRTDRAGALLLEQLPSAPGTNAVARFWCARRRSEGARHGLSCGSQGLAVRRSIGPRAAKFWSKLGERWRPIIARSRWLDCAVPPRQEDFVVVDNAL